MEDVSELFKIHFNLLHKGTAMSKTVQDRKEVLNNARKSKRDTLAYIRRNITEDISPINTPTPKKNRKLEKVSEKPNNLPEKNIEVPAKVRPKAGVSRLELLQKWRAEKAKKKEQEKAKAKPIFKVYHVSSDLTADLENANKVIKGKPIVPGSASKKSQFAPPNHKFKPPKGIKPLSFNTSTMQTQAPGFSSKSSSSKLKYTPLKKTRSDAIFKTSHQEPFSNSSNGSSKREPTTSRPREVKGHNYKSDSKKHLKEIVKPKAEKLNKDVADTLIKEVQKKTVAESDNTKTSINTKINHESKKAGSNTSNKKSTSTMNQRVTRNTTKATVDKTASAKAPIQKTPRKTVGSNIGESDLTERLGNGNLKNTVTYRKTQKNSKVLLEKNERDLETNKLNIAVDRVTLDSSDNKKPTKTSNDLNSVPQDNNHLLNSDAVQQSAPVGSCTAASSSSSTDYSVDYNNCLSAQSTESFFDNKTPPPVYVSPFVTISRGKNSARKEYKIRMSQSKCEVDKDTPELKNILSAHTSPKAGAAYFKRKLDTETNRITDICADWENYRLHPDLPEEAYSSIDVTIGQSKLLISKKFQQFRSLIFQCENENYEVKPVTCVDLHGFWDMIYMQVEDLDKRFLNLQKLKDNNWEEILPQKAVPVKRTRGRPKKAQTKSKIMQLIQEARKKPKEQQQPENEVVINGLNYAKILKTPSKENPLDDVMSSTKRKSLRMSVLNRESRSRCSSSPGLTMMKISQSIKQGDGLTPVRGILKSDVLRSTGKKSVVFKDLEKSPKTSCKANLFHELDKENISDNLINFSPAPLTPRRSNRLSKLKV